MKRLELFFTFFGGKWRVARHYPKPFYKTIIEPFAGSAGFALHYPGHKVFLFDLDPIVCGVWSYLINSPEHEILNLPLAVEDVRELKLPQEAKWLIGFWLNKGMTAPCNIPSKWMRNHAQDASRLNTYWGEGVRSRIARQLKHI
ncbi:MAG: DNA adenine methylase, partial [Bacteroidetes bacterium]|nr:DNA adenine methylase [Bacteroidota bacterium]